MTESISVFARMMSEVDMEGIMAQVEAEIADSEAEMNAGETESKKHFGQLLAMSFHTDKKQNTKQKLTPLTDQEFASLGRDDGLDGHDQHVRGDHGGGGHGHGHEHDEARWVKIS